MKSKTTTHLDFRRLKIGVAVCFFSLTFIPGQVTGENTDGISQQVLQTNEISGTITDSNENPISGAKVHNVTQNISVVTDRSGNFKIKASQGDEIRISKVGFFIYKKVISDFSPIYTQLSAAATDNERETSIEGVMITGYQKIQANKAAASYEKIDIKNFEKRASVDVVSGLEGFSPSLVLSTNPNNPSGSKELTIRGISTLAGSSRPLMVVDGFQYEGDLRSINPYEIESINLLKDAAATSIYGAKAANGVIVIATKKGKAGGLQIRYTNNLTFSEKANINYMMNRLSTNDLINLQENYAKKSIAQDNIISYQNSYETDDPYASYYINSTNRVYYLYSQYHYGYISENELNTELAFLRTQDNTNDLKKTYLQSPFTNQQNISLAGGSDGFKYRTSLNYTDELLSIRDTKNNRILFDFVSEMKLNPKLTFDFQTNLSLNNNKLTPLNYENTGNLNSFTHIFDISPYDRFYDEYGNAKAVTNPSFNKSSNNGGIVGGKDPYEIARLKEAGLLDETYFPALDFNKYSYTDKNWSVRVQGMLNYKISPAITARFGGQFQKGAGTTQNIANANSWYMTQLVNNTTPLSYSGDRRELNIPIGARLQETRSDSNVYLLRGQLDFNKTYGDHFVSALLGSEIQEIKSTGTSTDRFGYDINSNIYLPVDYYRLGQDIINVYAPTGAIYGGIPFNENYDWIQNRFFSAFANAHYAYKNKYIVTGSARIDQSNLFGTDPKYRYKPFWSVGVKWRAGEEAFLGNGNNVIDLRASFGFNGNIANRYGPYDIATKEYIFRADNSLGLGIQSYKIPNLRWEKTATTNFGLDTKLFNKRVDFTFDYYRKDTKDVLSQIEADPTQGSAFVARNDANIINNGYEIQLTTHNIKKENFIWDSQLNFRMNKGEVKKVFFDPEGYTASFFAGTPLNIQGHEPSTLFVFDYAGVNDKGYGQIHKDDGSVFVVDVDADPQNLSFNDLKAAGPTIPRYVAGFNNNITIKNFSLSFLFIYQGGHKLLKDSYNGNFIGRSVSLINSDAAKAWQKPGDENITDIPAINSAYYSSIIRGSSKNVIDGDFIRLRDVVVSYMIPKQYSDLLKLRELTLNMKAGNLWMWTKNKEGIDPESQGLGYRSLPLPKSFTLGLNLIF